MSIIRNSAWNVAGVVVPTLIAIPAFSYYSRVLGVERLGLLTLAFAVVGYASSFDLGLARALIREISIQRADPERIRALMRTATLSVFALGLVVTAVCIVYESDFLRYLKVSKENSPDAETAFLWLSCTIVPYLLSTVGASYFEGKEDFRAVNVIKTVSSILNSAGGVAALLVVPTLTSVLFALFAARVLTCLSTYELYRRATGRGKHTGSTALFDKASFLSLVRYGSWLTVSNIVGPVMMYFDRFILSHFSGAQQVAFYTVPSEAVSRLSLFPAAISRTMFPRLSHPGTSEREDRRLGMKLTLLTCGLTILPVFVFADVILRVWVGPAYAGLPVTVLRILLVGFFFNAMAFAPFTLLQAKGHSKVTAMIHVAELIPYLSLLVMLTALYGIAGTAVAWSVRTLADFALMQWFALRYAD